MPSGVSLKQGSFQWFERRVPECPTLHRIMVVQIG
jgi:hypothetical protein